VACGCCLSGDSLGHWEKRNRTAVLANDPERLDRDAIARLFRAFGDPPLGAKLRALFGSDIGHWDVRDMREVVEEAWEQVEQGLVSKDDFRAFSFENPVHFWTALRPDFFDGTSVESAARAALLLGKRCGCAALPKAG